MIKHVLHTKCAPDTIGSYSQGIKIGNLIYTSGQIALDPKTMRLNAGDFKSEIRQVLSNIDSVLICGGSSIQNSVKLTVYLTNLSLFSNVNEVFNEIFINDFPARSVIEVSALPMDANIEIDAVAVIK